MKIIDLKWNQNPYSNELLSIQHINSYEANGNTENFMTEFH